MVSTKTSAAADATPFQAGDLVRIARPNGSSGYLDRRVTYDGGSGERVNGLSLGLVGDGTTNNVAALKAILAVSGTYFIPAGRYVVEANPDFSDMVFIASNVDLLLDPEAILEFVTPAVPGLCMFEEDNIAIRGGVFEFSGEFGHDIGERMTASDVIVNGIKLAFLEFLNIVAAEYNIGDDVVAATISILGGSNILLEDVVIRGKTVANQQYAGISISPNADYTAAVNVEIIRPKIDDFTMGIIPGRGVKGLYIETPYFGRFAELDQQPGHAIYVSANLTCDANEDITIINAHDEGIFVGDQLTPAREDRGTQSFKFRKGKNITMLATTSRRAAGCFDVLGVRNGAFIGAHIAPRPVNTGTQPFYMRCANVNPELYLETNQNVVFKGIGISPDESGSTQSLIDFQALAGSEGIHLEVSIFRAGTSTAKPQILLYGAEEGTFDVTYFAEEAHSATGVVVTVKASATNVRGKLTCNFEPRVAVEAGAVVDLTINGRHAMLPLAAAPVYPHPYQIARADRVTWDPLSKGSGGSYLVMRNDANDAWVAIDGQG